MKKAFSLIELLIVLLIISIVYYLNINKLTEIKEKDINFLNLREDLNKIDFDNNIEILCINKINNCKLYIDGFENNNTIINKYFNKKIEIKSYKIKNNEIIEIFNEYKYINNIKENILLSIIFNKKKVFSQKIIKYNNFYYDLTEPIYIKKYENLNDIITYKRSKYNDL